MAGESTIFACCTLSTDTTQAGLVINCSAPVVGLSAFDSLSEAEELTTISCSTLSLSSTLAGSALND